jgi:ArsR family transcriptional regulator, arsenate/arsenite/antimonite-responsive transcriptional repressor
MDAPLLFKALSDPTRLRCIVLLVTHKELCVCELTHALALPQPKISHHLATLRRAGLVSDRKEGLWIYYRINTALPAWVIKLIQLTANDLKDKEPYSEDASALAEMPNRPIKVCNA